MQQKDSLVRGYCSPTTRTVIAAFVRPVAQLAVCGAQAATCLKLDAPHKLKLDGRTFVSSDSNQCRHTYM